MTENNTEDKKFKYLITMRWYVETDEDLVAGSPETDEKLLNLLRHKEDGRESCDQCPTRNNEGYAILNYHYFMGDKKPVYMSVDKVKKS
ncbi:MAG: hypothetical protein ACE5D0_05220 [Fidelibacterota bacterium]